MILILWASSVTWLAGGPAQVNRQPVDSSSWNPETDVHEASPAFVSGERPAPARETADLAVIADSIQPELNIVDLGDLTPDEVRANIAAFGESGDEPNRIGWVRSIGEQPITPNDLVSASTPTRGEPTIKAVAIRSDDAFGLRVHFQNFDLKEAEVVLLAEEASGVVSSGPYTGRGPNGTGDFWTGLLPGETVLVVLRGEGTAEFQISEVAHADRPIDGLAGDANVAGGPLGCQLDAMCSTDISSAARLATGQMNYVVAGQMKVCTGTLLNDLDNETTVPYFLTAYHCISSQSVADTLEVVWFWERASCGGTLPIYSSLPRSDGATLLATDDTADGNDMSFFRLKGQLPNGLALAGWTTAHPDSAFGIHHPAGSWKRVTYFSDVGSCGGCTFCGDPFDYDYYDMDRGIIEGGSSGSGIFNFSGQLAGQLRGHCCLYLSCAGEGITCGNVDEQAAYYGEFETTYPIIRRWLEIGGTIHVNGTGGCFPGLGTPNCPYPTVGLGYAFAWNGARIKIRTGTYPENPTFQKQVTVLADGGPVIIGQ